MLNDLTVRLSKFGLSLNEDKTRLLLFGKFASERRARRGLGRPETFDFLGFTHYCARGRDGQFIVKRKTQRKRMLRKLKELRRGVAAHAHVGDRTAQVAKRGFARALCILRAAGQLALTLCLRLRGAQALAPGSCPTQPARHDLGPVRRIARRFPLPTPAITRPGEIITSRLA